MPEFTIRDPRSGKTLTLRGDSPPTEAELETLFANAAAPSVAAAPAPPAPMPTPAGRPEEGMLSAALPAAVATGASLGLGKVPILSTAAAALGGAAGEGLRQIGRMMRDPIPEGPGLPAFKRLAGEAAAIPGAMLRQAAVQGAAEAVGGAVGKGAEALGTAVYRGYLKPSLSMIDLPKAREIVATGIREMLPITKAGEARAQRLISDINKHVMGLLNKSKAGRIELSEVATKVREFANRKYNRPGVPEEDLIAALKVADNIDNHPSLVTPSGAKITGVNPTDANKVKQGLDQAAGDKAFGIERGAATEARKAGRRATREAIERVAPEVGPLNARESKLIDALDAIQRASGREENRSALFGVPTLLAGSYGLAESSRSDPTEAAIKALVARGALTPAVATRAAILAAKFARVPGTSAAMAVRMAAILAMRESGAEEPAQ